MATPRSTASLDEWLRRIDSISPHDIELGLDRVSEVRDRLALPTPFRVLTVGGTNGKGSSVAMLEALLIEGGARVGCYTSPHILKYSERIRVHGEPASDASIVAAFERIDNARDSVPLTYFEFGTLAALCVFANFGVDSAILEVGLGGRLDAVNAIDADGCLITNISLDHCEWLGDNIELIGGEKAGIMRTGRPAVFGSKDMPDAIRQRALETDATLLHAGSDFFAHARDNARWDWEGTRHRLYNLNPPALRGQHQIENAAAVLALLESVGLTAMLQEDSVNRALSTLRLDGRLQRIDALGRRWLLDGAHNPAGARVLAAALSPLVQTGRVRAVLGLLEDKDAGEIISGLSGVVDHWMACTAESPRAVSGSDLGVQIAAKTGRPCRIEASVADALQAAQAVAVTDDLIIVAGSFFTVGPALRWLQKNQSGSDG